MSSSGSVYAWCGCRERVAGRRLGARCPQRGSEGHGSWYLSLELPAGPDARRRRIRRGGFPARADAQRALARLLRSSRATAGRARAPKSCGHTLVNPCPYREAAMRSPHRIRPGQGWWGARGSNPEPTD
jgi:hypothetical protein